MTQSPSDNGSGAASAVPALAARGWPVVPLHTAAEGACSCGRPGCESPAKHPRTLHGLKDATTDLERIAQWWASFPDANVGVRTGDGLVVLDVDGDTGAESLHELERRHEPLPRTVSVRTGGGGAHYYFACDEPLRGSASKLGAGLDVRADGGYVVAPPSRHASGRAYEWDEAPEDAALAPLPVWLLALMRDSVRPVAAATNGAVVIVEGGRNSALTSLAGAMRRRGSGAEEIGAALRVANRTRCNPPLPDREVDAIAASVSRYEPEPEVVDATPSAGPVFEVLTARDTCRIPDPPGSDELLGPLLVRGSRLLLGAYTGHGKTTLTFQIVRAIVESSEFLGWRGAGGRALVIDAEQGLRTVKRRLREAGLEDSDAVDVIRVPDGLALDRDESHIAAVEHALATGGYDVVAADPLYKLHRGESNEERAAVDLMRRFDGWREEHRFGLILPMHCRKPPPQNAKFSMHEFLGSGAWLFGGEVVIGLQRVRDGYAHLHFFKDRDGDLPISTKWGLLFDRERGFRRDPDDEVPKQTTADQLRELLAAQPDMTEAQLMEATGKAERTIRNALKAIGARSTRAGTTAPKLWSLSEEDELQARAERIENVYGGSS